MEEWREKEEHHGWMEEKKNEKEREKRRNKEKKKENVWERNYVATNKVV